MSYSDSLKKMNSQTKRDRQINKRTNTCKETHSTFTDFTGTKWPTNRVIDKRYKYIGTLETYITRFTAKIIWKLTYNLLTKTYVLDLTQLKIT